MEEHSATTPGPGPARVALVTCAEVPALDHDSRRLVPALTARGVAATPVVWDDPAADWAGFDLSVIRSCWDYVPRRAAFVAWAYTVPRLANPADVIEWNTDKRYLRDLEAAGHPVVPTTWLRPGHAWTLPESGQWVVKPAVGMAGLDTGRYRLADAGERRLCRDHVRRLLDAGREVMVQPYLAAVDSDGETSLVYLGGELSHTVRKSALLGGPDTGADHRFARDGGLDIRPRRASADQRRTADRVLASVPGGPDRLLYARVDLVPGPDGHPLLLELELTEPQLFLARAPGAADRLAAAISARVDRPRRPDHDIQSRPYPTLPALTRTAR